MAKAPKAQNPGLVAGEIVEQVVAGKEGAIRFRSYQKHVFLDRTSGILVLHWSRQIGKSYSLAAWAVDRLLSQLEKYDSWLVTVLSNSRDNGAEFVIKCQEVCRKMGLLLQERQAKEIGGANVYVAEDQSSDIQYDNMRMEVRITVNIGGRTRIGRIKVLAANPRTARGFSGDLILDEFAFHENSAAIWEAAEPILSANPEFLCRIASTGNGKYNMFYRMASGDGPFDGAIFTSQAGFKVSRVSRSEAWKQGVKIYDSNTRKPITPDMARAQALDKRAYDQNYECAFNDENRTLLTHELISAAEREDVGFICEQDWSPACLARLAAVSAPLYVGVDVGRKRDLTVITVIEKVNGINIVRGILRIEGMRLPQQQIRLGEICRLPQFRRAALDMTGIGLGLFEYSQDEFGASRIQGVNFASTVVATKQIKAEGRKQETVRVTEAMATELLQTYEDRRIQHPSDGQLRDDLRKPEKVVSPGGRVSIAATRDEAGHADHFWSFALGIEAGNTGNEAGPIHVFDNRRNRVLASRRERSCEG